MVEFKEKQELSKYKTILAETKEQDNTSDEITLYKESDNVVLFFSFDIVNSSIYKTVNYYGWSIVIDNIISELRQLVRGKITRAEVWRVLGDEIIFIVNICDTESVYEYVESIYKILNDFCEHIERGTFFDKMDKISNTMINLMKVENIISLKACAWIAAVTDKNEIKEKSFNRYVENLFEIIEEGNNIKFYEFIGIDIDAGFRLTEQTRERRLALSFELAYLLSKRKEFVQRLNIVTYRSLKGVWDNSAYPIIWYYDKTKHENRTFKRSFPFDAIEKDEIYLEFFKNRKFPDYMYEDAKGALKKILRDRKLEEKIERIERIIEESKDNYKQYIENPKLELHCATVCYNEEGKVLIVKRANREILEGKWEFGCAKANSKRDLIECIVEEYRKDFGINIEICVDEGRQDKQPVPIAIYKIEKNGEMHKGVIFMAKIISGEVELNQKKHTDFKFINESEVNQLEDEECVSDMKETLNKVFQRIKEVK